MMKITLKLFVELMKVIKPKHKLNKRTIHIHKRTENCVNNSKRVMSNELKNLHSFTVPRDPFIRWRKVIWNSKGTLVFVTSSLNTIHVLNQRGIFLIIIKKIIHL
jgi:hypothetical protein